MMKMFEGRFAGRTAVVTGGASGLGRDVARRIVAEGGRVSLWDLNADLVAEAASAIGASHVAILDVGDHRAVAEAAVSAHTALGRIDVLVNSAGITGATAPLHEYPVDNWIRVIEVNLHGTFYCCRAVVPFMLASGTGAW
jgi:3-oxoacyl-[acyl-carrier protein] reductase